MEEPGRTGVWIIGALGGLATTVILGSRVLASGRCSSTGLLTSRKDFEGLALTPPGELVFGGHEIRSGDLVQGAREICRQNGSLKESWIESLSEDLLEISSRIRPGVLAGAGPAIQRLADREAEPARSGREVVTELALHLREFRQRTGVERLVVMNLASTEPPTEWSECYLDPAVLDHELDRQQASRFRPGLLYAYAAFREGAGYVNFTPSSSALCPSLETIAKAKQLPYMGNDGKTGETLVKSALAPMFKHRHLAVDSWSGYNLLGNRDGEVLADEDTKRSKLSTKDSVIAGILGYQPQTHVGIDFVRSLGDNKVAWDFIHFRGFLDYSMSLQFVWQGCDSILAAPLVLDLARLMEHALRRGLGGPQTHLACYFKSPLHLKEHDLGRQIALLEAYARTHSLS